MNNDSVESVSTSGKTLYRERPNKQIESRLVYCYSNHTAGSKALRTLNDLLLFGWTDETVGWIDELVKSWVEIEFSDRVRVRQDHDRRSRL